MLTCLRSYSEVPGSSRDSAGVARRRRGCVRRLCRRVRRKPCPALAFEIHDGLQRCAASGLQCGRKKRQLLVRSELVLAVEVEVTLIDASNRRDRHTVHDLQS